jgi:hypothetical protein
MRQSLASNDVTTEVEGYMVLEAATTQRLVKTRQTKTVVRTAVNC